MCESDWWSINCYPKCYTICLLIRLAQPLACTWTWSYSILVFIKEEASSLVIYFLLWWSDGEAFVRHLNLLSHHLLRLNYRHRLHLHLRLHDWHRHGRRHWLSLHSSLTCLLTFHLLNDPLNLIYLLLLLLRLLEELIKQANDVSISRSCCWLHLLLLWHLSWLHRHLSRLHRHLTGLHRHLSSLHLPGLHHLLHLWLHLTGLHHLLHLWLLLIVVNGLLHWLLLVAWISSWLLLLIHN